MGTGEEAAEAVRGSLPRERRWELPLAARGVLAASLLAAQRQTRCAPAWPGSHSAEGESRGPTRRDKGARRSLNSVFPLECLDRFRSLTPLPLPQLSVAGAQDSPPSLQGEREGWKWTPLPKIAVLRSKIAVLAPELLFTGCVTLNSSLHFPGLSFSLCQATGMKWGYFCGISSRSREL